MKLFLISSEYSKFEEWIQYNEITNFPFVIVEPTETSESFRDKLSTLQESFPVNFEDLTGIEILYDNKGTGCPMFKTIPPQEESVTYEEFTLPNGIVEVMERITTSAPIIINSSNFYSEELMSEIDYIKSLTTETLELSVGYSDEAEFTFKSFEVDPRGGLFDMFPRLGFKATVPEITTPQELYDLMTSTDPVEMDYTYTLMNDIDMSGFDCESIGKIGSAFTGTFNGNGKTITISQVLSNRYSGLFYNTNGATIENLTLKYTMSSLPVTTDTFENAETGSLCATGFNTTFSNCQAVHTANGQEMNLSLGTIYVDTLLSSRSMFGVLTNSTIINCTLIDEEYFTIINEPSGSIFQQEVEIEL